MFRVAPEGMPLDHTSILKTVQQRWDLPALTARDAAAPSVAGVLTLSTPRTDDVLTGVTVPTAGAQGPSAVAPSHLQRVQADLMSRRYPAGRHEDADRLGAAGTNSVYADYIRRHSATPPA